MTPNATSHDISKTRVVYAMPSTDAVRILRDQEYRCTDEGALTMDVYYPPDANGGSRTPAVVFVTGFRDVGAKRTFGCAMKGMGAYVSWARLVAASGMVAVAYTNQDPATDAHAVIKHLRDHAASLGIDDTRIGLWSCSGNVPAALSLVLGTATSSYVKCAALCYGYMLDTDGATGVADAAALFGFVNPCAGRRLRTSPVIFPSFWLEPATTSCPI